MVIDRMMNSLEQTFPNTEPEVLKSTKVGPTVAKDIKEGAVKAVIFALIGMFLYIVVSFRGWQFGLGGVGSLIFNVVTVMGLFVIMGTLPGLPFSVEIDQAYIAAVLTIVGYTINDTVVVFDRIRENLQLDKIGTNREELFNRSVNITLARTTITSVTTLLTVLIMFLFGGEILRGFLLALFVGIIVGTLSTIFLASPVALDLGAGTQLQGREAGSSESGSAKTATA
jgi:protein-export membrane protein SecF